MFCGPSMVFTNVYNPRSAVARKDEYRRDAGAARRDARRQLHDRLRRDDRRATPSSAPARWSRTTSRLTRWWSGVPARQIGWMSRHGERLDLPLDGEGEARLSGDRRALSCSTAHATLQAPHELTQRRIHRPQERSTRRSQDDIDRSASQRVLDHGQYIMGPEVAELEAALAAYAGASIASPWRAAPRRC